MEQGRRTEIALLLRLELCGNQIEDARHNVSYQAYRLNDHLKNPDHHGHAGSIQVVSDQSKSAMGYLRWN